MLGTQELIKDTYDNIISVYHCNLRIKLILEIAVKLNSIVLKSEDIDHIFKAILIGITSGDGLGFNRAFLFLKDRKSGDFLGMYALGPKNYEDAIRIWREIERLKKTLFDILDEANEIFSNDTNFLNSFIKGISIKNDLSDPLVFKLYNYDSPFKILEEDKFLTKLPKETKEIIFSEESYASPIKLGGDLIGFILVDNRFNNRQILEDDLQALNLFVGTLSVAISRFFIMKEYEEKIEKLKRIYKESEKNREILLTSERFSAIGTMLDHILHEIRNPLSTLGGLVRLITKKTADSELKMYGEKLLDLVERLENTLENLSNFTYPPLINIETFNFLEVIDACIYLLHRNIENNHIKLEIKYQNEEIITRGDKKLLKNAFYNLFKNSIDAMPEGGLFVVSIEEEDDELRVKIVDTGLGVAVGHLRVIDQPFFTTKTQSMGLGLTVAKNIIEAHDGTLKISKNKYGGTTVNVTLPKNKIPSSI